MRRGEKKQNAAEPKGETIGDLMANEVYVGESDNDVDMFGEVLLCKDDSTGVADGPGENPLQEIRDALRSEVGNYVATCRRSSATKCALFPFRRFARACRLTEHCAQYRISSNRRCASGTTQLRVCLALYDNDSSCATAEGNISAPLSKYIRRSAAVMRAQMLRSIPDMEKDLSLSNMVDRHVRIVQYAEGPAFRLTDYVEAKKAHVQKTRIWLLFGRFLQ